MATQAENGGCDDPSPNHFTGKQRDAESGLDNFTALITLRVSAADFGNKSPLEPANEIPVAMKSKFFIAGFRKQ